MDHCDQRRQRYARNLPASGFPGLNFRLTGNQYCGMASASYLNVAPLTPAATYYCRVKATDAAMNTNGFGSARRFHTWESYICGDANNSGEVDISDAVYLIEYIFSGGTPPIPYVAGDVDCSGVPDISDVVYLIAYIFSGGAAPCLGC